MRLADVVAKLTHVGLGLSGDSSDDTGQFVFKNGRVSAHNGIFGLWSELDIGIETALPGDTLLAIVLACDGPDVEFTSVGDAVRITSGRTRVMMKKLEITGKEMPELEGVAVDWRPEWSDALEKASWSMSDDPQRPDLAGITMSSVDGAMVFYSTIGMGITRCRIVGESEEELVGSAMIIPTRYMWAVQRVIGTLPFTAIQFSDECLHTVFGPVPRTEGQASSPGDDIVVHLYGNFVSNARPERYEDTIAGITEGLEWKAMPDGFAATLARVEAAGGKDALTDITASHGKMMMHTKAEFGHLDDVELTYDGDIESITVKAAVLKRAAAAANEIAISGNCVGFRTGEGFMYVQATVSDAPSTPASPPAEEE